MKKQKWAQGPVHEKNKKALEDALETLKMTQSLGYQGIATDKGTEYMTIMNVHGRDVRDELARRPDFFPSAQEAEDAAFSTLINLMQKAAHRGCTSLVWRHAVPDIDTDRGGWWFYMRVAFE